MDYLWLKAIHVAAAITWVGGILVTALSLSVLSRLSVPRSAVAVEAIRLVRRWDRTVTSPAMGLFWVLGLWMAYAAGWFAAPWFIVKLAIAFALSGLHGSLSGTLRRLEGNPARPAPAGFRKVPAAIVASVAVIVVLVVVKPF